MCLCYGFLGVGDEVYFDQGVAGGVVFAADDRGGAGGRALDDNGRFLRIRRSSSARLNLGLWRDFYFVGRCLYPAQKDEVISGRKVMCLPTIHFAEALSSVAHERFRSYVTDQGARSFATFFELTCSKLY